ncbi:MAG: DUF1925 domain-containing protein [Dehalococcoidia bacterium]|nr:DUF1925 domain-containing protein [Dehalococcoidia bacterium]
MSPAPVHLALVFHQHQPVGNHESVFEELFARAYDPLVSALERHRGVRCGLHYSGPLLEWFEERHPEFIERIRVLVERGQAELLGGAYFEPVLAAIPERDRTGQFARSRAQVERLFGRVPTGAWIPELAWEPHFPAELRRAGFEWTVLDDTQFEAAGFDTEDLGGWYLTEDGGEALALFPASTHLEDLTPWGSIDEWFGYLRQRGERHPGGLVSLAIDGEKLGGWSGTFLRAWEHGWVDELFTRLESEMGWLSITLPGEQIRDHEPQSLAYIPSSAHRGLDGWALPPHLQRGLDRARRVLEIQAPELVRFTRGSHWRHFLIRYPEANLLQKRGLILSSEAHAQVNDEALDHTWRALSSNSMWHGVAGGIYLEHLRHASFGHLARADALLFPGAQPPDVRDWDLDGRDEVCLRSDDQLAIVSPGSGGLLTHWELRKPGWHLTHVLARRPEVYHDSLDTWGMAFDRGLRLAAQETILGVGASRDAYTAQRQASQPEVHHWTLGEDSIELDCRLGEREYRKIIRVLGALECHYRICADGRLCSEWNVSLPAGEDDATPRFTLEEHLVSVETPLFTLSCTHNADDLWVDAVVATVQTDRGAEAVTQGWSLVFVKNLNPDAATTLDLCWKEQR